jgi:SPP1 gp7 family putative phage head morphogenesis protein
VSNLSAAFNLRPEGAIKYMEAKGYKVTGSWKDMLHDAHSKAFTVANVAKADVLQDIKGMIEQAQKNGESFNKFKNNIIPALKSKGWYGKGFDQDGNKLISPTRLDLIYRQNLQSSYMTGRYSQQLDVALSRPWWRYSAVMDSRTRPAHAALHGKVFRFDDPIWATHYPPNGWRCRCTVTTLSDNEIDRDNIETSDSEGTLKTKNVNANGVNIPVTTYTDPVTGKTVTPDVGWSYNPGMEAWKPKLEKYSKEIRFQLKTVLKNIPDIKTTNLIPDEVFKPASTIKEAEEFAKRNKLASTIEYKKLSLEAVNQINQSLFETYKEFPMLRPNMEFIGSGQKQNSIAKQLRMAEFKQTDLGKSLIEKARRIGLSDKEIEKQFSKYAHRGISNINPRTLAFAVSKGVHTLYKGVYGIGFNEKLFDKKHYTKLLEILKRDVDSKFHPIGCDTTKSIVDHELGHQIDSYLGRVSETPEFRNLVKDFLKNNIGDLSEHLSRYPTKVGSKQQFSEIFAEAWAEIKNNQDPRPLATKILEFINIKRKELGK